jgi:hypothetical protein
VPQLHGSKILQAYRKDTQQRRDHLSAAQIRRFEALLRTPTEITADMTHFTTDPAPIYAHRRAIAEAIEALSR